MSVGLLPTSVTGLPRPIWLLSQYSVAKSRPFRLTPNLR